MEAELTTSAIINPLHADIICLCIDVPDVRLDMVDGS